MRLVFAGTPAAAVPSLRELAARHEIVAVITRRDAEVGRKRVLTPSPVAVAAAELGLETIKANRLDASVTARIQELAPDLGAIVAYGGLVREPLLSTPRLGWINLHFSLLPRWRGAAPVQRAVIAGERETGAAVFQLVPELDAGAVFSVLRRPIEPDETSGALLDSLALSGAALLASTVDDLAAGAAVAVPQQGEPTLAPKLGLADAHLDFTLPGDAVYARLRGVTPEPGAFALLAGDRFKILAARAAASDDDDAAAAAGDGDSPAPGAVELRGRRVLVGTGTHPLELLTVQPAGKRAMASVDWWHGLNGEKVVLS
ncbi:methionyl-tRNA formyltransferase [Leifsonia sp. NPDC058292]|uniref:methionyl-tRNA formyltransferase n=1 Tax=Leifsonia sp. NPDC058292 TaxID=3346428 RepID=UPI0036D7FE78